MSNLENKLKKIINKFNGLDKENAYIEIKNLSQKYKKNLNVQNILSQIAINMGDIDTAISALKNILFIERNNSTALNTIYKLLIHKKEFDEALNYIKIAKKEYESYAIAFSCQEAELYRTKNEHLKTVSIIKPELKMHPTLANMHYLYCVSLSFLDDKKTFIKQFKDYLDYCDNILPWRYFIILACYYFELGHHQKGKEILTYIIKIQKTYPELAIQHKLAMKKNDQENYIYDIDMFVDLIEDCHQILNQFEKITS